MNTKTLLDKLNTKLEPQEKPKQPMTQEEYNAGLDRLVEQLNNSFKTLKEAPKTEEVGATPNDSKQS